MDDLRSMTVNGFWKAVLGKLYGSLKMSDPVQPVDLIFVMAGRMERKRYGLQLFRTGVSPRLILSVGRFEVRKMVNLDLVGLDGLVELRDHTPPRERHFFVSVDGSGVGIQKAEL